MSEDGCQCWKERHLIIRFAVRLFLFAVGASLLSSWGTATFIAYRSSFYPVKTWHGGTCKFPGTSVKLYGSNGVEIELSDYLRGEGATLRVQVSGDSWVRFTVPSISIQEIKTKAKREVEMKPEQVERATTKLVAGGKWSDDFYFTVPLAGLKKSGPVLLKLPDAYINDQLQPFEPVRATFDGDVSSPRL